MIMNKILRQCLVLLAIPLATLASATAGATEASSLEFIATEAPLFPTEARGAPTCYEYFLALAEAKCTIYDSESLPVKVHHCLTGDATGVLVLERTRDAYLGHADATGTAIYRLRVTGPDGLWLLEPTYCRPDFALASYELLNPGLFSVEVLMLYSSFTFLKPNASRALQEPWAGYLTLDVQLASPGIGAKSVERPRVRLAGQHWTSAPNNTVVLGDVVSIHDTVRRFKAQRRRSRRQKRDVDGGGASAMLPLCPDTGPLPGRWHFTEWPLATPATATTASALLRTCIWYTTADPAADCSGPERELLRLDSYPAGLTWQPYSCRLRAFAGLPPPSQALPSGDSPPPAPPALESITPAVCLTSGRRVCFIGDSHTRYLHNSLALWQGGFRGTVNNTAKELLTSDNTYYESMKFGNDWPSGEDGSSGTSSAAAPLWEPLAAAGCTDVVANFGQWPASYRAGPAPYSALRYLRELLRVRHVLLDLSRARPGLRVFWVTTCMSSLKARLESAGVDWRTDPLLALYNRMALDVMSGALPAELMRMQSHARGPARSQAEVAAGHATAATGLGSGSHAFLDERGDQDGGSASRVLEWLRRAMPGRGGHWRRQLLTLVEEAGKEQAAWREVPDPVFEAEEAIHSAAAKKGAAGLGTATTRNGAGGDGVGAVGAGAAAAGREAIPVIDTWSASRILHDATWDGVHFANTGAVGLVQLNVLLHALCSAQVKG